MLVILSTLFFIWFIGFFHSHNFYFFLRISIFLLNSHPCCWLSHPGLELTMLLFHLFVWILFEGIDHLKRYSFEFFIWHFSYFCIYLLIQLLGSYKLLEESYCLVFSCFLYFCIVNFASVRMNISCSYLLIDFFVGVFRVESLLLGVQNSHYYSKMRKHAGLTAITIHEHTRYLNVV
jgi:hypothetical protein